MVEFKCVERANLIKFNNPILLDDFSLLLFLTLAPTDEVTVITMQKLAQRFRQLNEGHW